MHRAFLVLVYAACVGYGRRVNTAEHSASQNNDEASSKSLVELKQLHAGTKAEVPGPSKFALLMLGLDASSAAFGPSGATAGHGYTPPASSTYIAPSGSRSAVLMTQSDDFDSEQGMQGSPLDKGQITRRDALRAALALPLAAPLQAAEASETEVRVQGLQEADVRVQIRGPEPTDIGIQQRPNALKPCSGGGKEANCLSSSRGVNYDTDYSGADYRNVDWLVEPFEYNARKKPFSEAMADIKGAIATYKAGQSGIDGGGVSLIKESSEGEVGYLYAQFVSEQGNIDDMEFAIAQGVCNVRTASRLGKTDSGVNAKRYEYFSEILSFLGWRTERLRRAGHTDYFDLNGLRDSDMTLF